MVGSVPNLALGVRLDLLHNAVAMPCSTQERQEKREDGWGQR